jgi:hypothetical protein
VQLLKRLVLHVGNDQLVAIINQALPGAHEIRVSCPERL